MLPVSFCFPLCQSRAKVVNRFVAAEFEYCKGGKSHKSTCADKGRIEQRRLANTRIMNKNHTIELTKVSQQILSFLPQGLRWDMLHRRNSDIEYRIQAKNH